MTHDDRIMFTAFACASTASAFLLGATGNALYLVALVPSLGALLGMIWVGG